jgi:hypothetical protein
VTGERLIGISVMETGRNPLKYVLDGKVKTHDRQRVKGKPVAGRGKSENP